MRSTESSAIEFELDDDTLSINDALSGRQVTAETDGFGSLVSTTADWFLLPVDEAVAMETTRLRFTGTASAHLRNVDGQHVGSLDDGSWNVDGPVYLDLETTLKVYVYIDSDAEVRSWSEDGAHHVEVRATEPHRLVVGVRSRHERPRTTIRTTGEPAAMRDAISHIGAATKEWSSERSWPNLRGYPPEIAVTDHKHIPSSVSVPDTGVEVAVPDSTEALLRVTPLAHYFGATVVTGDEPELRLANGHTESLGTGQELEKSVDRLLVRGLVLDSLVRRAGYFQFDQIAYDKIGSELPFYPPELYDEPIHRQLLEYLEVPYELIDEVAPRWQTRALIGATPSELEAVPDVLASLGRIHVRSGVEWARSDGPLAGKDDAAAPTPSPFDSSAGAREPVESMLTAVTCPTAPPGATYLSEASRRRRRDSKLQSAVDCSVALAGVEKPVGLLESADWSGPDIDLSVIAASQPSRAELAALLSEDHLLVHVALPVTEGGIRCCDGVLRFDELDELNAGCISVAWESSSLAPLDDIVAAGIPTCVAAPQQLSIREAELLGKYLIIGFPLVVATRLAGLPRATRFVGDASRPLVARQDGSPDVLCDVQCIDTDRYRLDITAVVAAPTSLGSVSAIKLDPHHDKFQLHGSSVESPTAVSMEELLETRSYDLVYRLNGRVHHSETLAREHLESLSTYEQLGSSRAAEDQ